LYCAWQVLKGPSRPFIAISLKSFFTDGNALYTTIVSNYVYKHVIVFDIFNEIITSISTSNPNIEKLLDEALAKDIPIDGNYHKVCLDRVLTYGNIEYANLIHCSVLHSLINSNIIYLWLAYEYFLTSSSSVSNPHLYRALLRNYNSFIPSPKGGNDYGIMGVILGKLKGGKEISKDYKPYYPGEYYEVIFDVDALACGIRFLTNKLMCKPVTLKVLLSKGISRLPQDSALLFLYYYPRAQDSLPLVIGFNTITDQALSYYLLGKAFVLSYIRNAIATECSTVNVFIDENIIDGLYSQLYSYLHIFPFVNRGSSIPSAHVLINNLRSRYLVLSKGNEIVHVPYNVFKQVNQQIVTLRTIVPNLISHLINEFVNKRLTSVGAAFKTRYCCFKKTCEERDKYDMILI
jgi:hypothetical protein